MSKDLKKKIFNLILRVLLLNLNKNITHLTSGNFENNGEKEILFFASENIIIAYGIYYITLLSSLD